jgi:hypothetical protein
MRGWQRVATSVAMYSTRRTYDRPPIALRWPVFFPESRFNGATPTSLAIWPRLNFPSSGNSASSVRIATSKYELQAVIRYEMHLAADVRLQPGTLNQGSHAANH